jgi:CheY-like chemotaxis protein
MAEPKKVLIVDDEQDLVELYQEFLSHCGSKPEVRTATSGARALALLEAEPFHLLITDLNMPSMDGFQLLTLVRRKYPSVRSAVMSSTVEDQFRSRAYGMGIDLYLEKPKSKQEVDIFVECVESLLSREEQGGFRGVQSKSLADIIQMECLSQASMVLKITNGGVVARIFIQGGDLIDAEVADLRGEEAFKKILSWKSGNFENLPPEPTRERVIFNSYQGLLLDSAQAMDEASGTESAAPSGDGTSAPGSRLGAIAKNKGVEFVVQVNSTDPKQFEQWGCENGEKVAEWTRKTISTFALLGERLRAGALVQIECLGSQRHAVLLTKAEKDLCVAFQRKETAEQFRETMKHISIQWAS